MEMTVMKDLIVENAFKKLRKERYTTVYLHVDKPNKVYAPHFTWPK